ncbi:MAG: helicase-exonuclease AddAB subunit AddA [Clostridia bacterium]|nr:helicase-exonuclease AddAB subunit AddA [Clostridia bacterium]NCC42427.1 helicase-exonuclease AddAB subunit AddA [Clostridia bacterium]
MGVKWTKEQEQVIRLQNRNILVSAAAGSGKTAVLVERILHMMTRKEHPVDIDKLLIVTFTRAAAGEMKERLSAAVEKQLEAEPQNEHLQRQQTLIHNAQITTIDGFCSYIIRNYFHTIDLDPGFRVANEGELKLLKYDVAKELLEKNYGNEDEEGNGSFRRFVEVFAAGKTDDGLIDLILRMYEFAMSNPWPKEWLEDCKIPYLAQSVDEVNDSLWMKKLWIDVEKAVEQAEELLKQNEELVAEEDGPHTYEEAVKSDKILLRTVAEACKVHDFDKCAQIFSNMKFVALSRKKDENVSDKKKEMSQSIRDEFKEVLKGLKERYFYGGINRILEELAICREPVIELIRLTIEFIDDYGEKKRQKNIVDFSDMEHFALDILVQKKNDELIYTPVADEFSERFEEIMIDEYQDSNLVQETLLQSVSRVRQGKYNIFMVGDVKQSIYRFRLARPELFMEKYENYSHDESECQRIDLHKNFRSRTQVLAGVNYIFEQIMGKELGDVEYDEAAALYPGAAFPERESAEEGIQEEQFEATEIMIAKTGGDEFADDHTDSTTQELEARMIGERILQMVDHDQVIDKQTGTYRPVCYKDCVILLRTITGWAETFVSVLTDLGIPAYATSKTGYFSTREVVTVLNYLRICDNPMQEIPLTGVLLSPIVGCTPEELALIKSSYPGKKIYEAVWKYAEEGEENLLCKRLREFFTQYELIRERVPYTPIHELIQLILQMTDYDTYAAAMPGGIQRKANLEMLVEKAMEFESTSYRGLFNFIRYIEQLQKYQVDFGEVSISGENEDTVRIMSIHKSKGLEFPIVFVSGMGKRFNMMDANANLIIHPDLGVGIWGIDPVMRVKMPVLMRQVIQKQIRLESLGEELRVLYVALTRAKEKLIITGCMGNISKRAESLHHLTSRKEIRLSYGMLEKAQDFWGWILPAFARHPAFDPLYALIGSKSDFTNPCWKKEIKVKMGFFLATDMVGRELEHQISSEQLYGEFMNWKKDVVYQEELRGQLEERFSYTYPYKMLQEIPAKVSVSELKRAEFVTEELVPEEFAAEEYEVEEAQEFIKESTIVPIVPEFMQQGEEKELKGAARGTAHHRILECLDYRKADSEEDIKMQIEKMEESGKIDEDMRSVVRVKNIWGFVKSPVGQRMKQAESVDRLRREQQFVMSIPASEKNPEWDMDEQILVQGIIDAYFEESDGLVLVDYKTDHVNKGQEDNLIEKYRKQLQYYADALERVGRQKVKEAYIYSFALGKALPVSL